MNQNWFDCCPPGDVLQFMAIKDWRIRWQKSHGSHGWVAPVAPRPARNTISQSTQPESLSLGFTMFTMTEMYTIHDDRNVWNVWNEDDTKTCWIDLKILKHPADSVVLLFSGWGQGSIQRDCHPNGQNTIASSLDSWWCLIWAETTRMDTPNPMVYHHFSPLKKQFGIVLGWILFGTPFGRCFLWNFISYETS